ncbi:MAG: hypothetical protein LBG90_05725, partial [Spirochaetaceae bacterium]|nr:hypothetical protein [Spirochaetaceae bacterium]
MEKIKNIFQKSENLCWQKYDRLEIRLFLVLFLAKFCGDYSFFSSSIIFSSCLTTCPKSGLSVSPVIR